VTSTSSPGSSAGRGDEVSQLLELAVEVAVEAGGVVMSHFSSAGTTKALSDSIRTKSSRTDLVTAADQASEQVVVARLGSKRPDDAILAEEGGLREGTSGLTWVVDPLDGTINFVYGLPVFGVSIAVQGPLSQGRPQGGPADFVASQGLDTTLVGVVHDPLRNETFTATKGGGAYRDGVPLVLGPGPAISESLIGTGFSYDSKRRLAQAHLLTGVLPHVRDIRRAGAAALDLCWVAAGRLDGLFEAGLAPWDIAAGALVVTEAGGTIEQVGGLLKGDEVATLIAAAPGLGGPLRALLEGTEV
jgi:myo-inositol-1(or 4)-monophosphatase